MGGAAPLELRRVGRYSDGWLPSFCTPEDVKTGIDTVNGHAADADREIDQEHFGVLVGYTDGPIPDRLVEIAQRRNPDRDPRDIIATRDNLAAHLESFIEVGASKFVVVPLNEPTDWTAEIKTVAARVLPLEN